MKKVLVTGSAGMIGSHFVDYLLENTEARVIGVDNFSFGNQDNIEHQLPEKRFEFQKADILDKDAMIKLAEGCDLIVHLAAVKKIWEKDLSHPTLIDNAIGTHSMLETARHYGTKILVASTSDVYGVSPEIPFKEDGNLLIGPSKVKRWGYAVSKLFTEQLAMAYHYDYNLPVVVTRYFGGFSYRSRGSWSGGHIPIFIDAILNDKPVNVHGDGSQTRSMSCVTDLVRGTYLACIKDKAVGEVINLGNDEEMSVLDSAKLIHEIANTGKELKVNFVPFKEVFGNYKELMRRIPDLTLAKEILGYEPKMNLKDAIAKAIAEKQGQQ